MTSAAACEVSPVTGSMQRTAPYFVCLRSQTPCLALAPNVLKGEEIHWSSEVAVAWRLPQKSIENFVLSFRNMSFSRPSVISRLIVLSR
jgi:hypothetical protein